MIEEALLTRARPRLDGRGNRFLRQAFLPARGLDDDALVRTRGRQVFVTTPFDVLACRPAPEEIPQLTTKVSLLIDGPSASTSPNDVAWLRPGALPQEKGFELLDIVSADDVLKLP